jgi:3-methyladenine DNA glycosylase/8-oxoguanine DNA glycosylase
VTEFAVPLPAGYRRSEVLDFYARDPLSVSERVHPDGLDKCALVEVVPALLEIRFEGDTAICRTDASDLTAARGAIVRMLGLDSEAAEFEEKFCADSLLGAVISRQRGLRIPLTPDPWEALAWAIMGQQISLKVAVMLRRNLIAAAGELHPSGLRAHPSAATVAALDLPALRELKFSGSKAEYILAAARAVASGELPIMKMKEMPVAEAARMAAAVRGIGPWTIQYFFLRGLGLADCLPAGDAGLAQGLARICGTRPSEAEIRRMLAPYAPWRSLATYHIWASLKEPIEPRPDAASVP